MYLLLLGAIAVGAGLLLVYYTLKDKNKKDEKETKWDPKDKGKVIYLFDEEDDDGSGFVDPKSDKPKPDKSKTDETPKPEKPKSEDSKDDK